MNRILTRIKLRADTADNWSVNNPVLLIGEVGIDLTNNILKVGDGTTSFNSLKPIYKDYLDAQGMRISDIEAYLAGLTIATTDEIKAIVNKGA